MNLFKKTLSLTLALLLALSLTACGGKQEAPAPAEPPAQEAPAQETPAAPIEDPITTRIAALKGPTAMGLVKLMSDDPQSASGPMYDFTLAGAADEVTPSLIKGDLDMACVPANLASVLYNKTEGQIVTLAVNTLGVLYIVENGNAVQSMADLAGKTIVAAGKGSTPEYALRYLLSENGIDPDKDVTIDWKSEHAECVAALASGAATIALLPQPFVTVAQTKIEGLRMALDLTAEWDALDNGSGMITGVVVARKSFVEEHPAAVGAFLQDYAASVDWVNSNNADAAQLISQFGIIEAAPVAQKALPYCNIVCITGEEMTEKLTGYLQVLFDAQPAAVGGKLPGDDFCYNA
ncbi:ABC transporter substrate-binding protein [Oscillibacter sp.]|uniref:ABC transporter substrate-binding protein n=1 Tax=Oscillibacter sp. TaxID=1945593 RepID=UPI001B6DB4D8|nr:ABC transporter substrate-binding protein [Oscillibacter sp.]MBP3508383.1 ABC transporter substrate-binding protein [Oscillibacter sp.]